MVNSLMHKTEINSLLKVFKVMSENVPDTYIHHNKELKHGWLAVECVFAISNFTLSPLRFHPQCFLWAGKAEKRNNGNREIRWQQKEAINETLLLLHSSPANATATVNPSASGRNCVLDFAVSPLMCFPAFCLPYIIFHIRYGFCPAW